MHRHLLSNPPWRNSIRNLLRNFLVVLGVSVVATGCSSFNDVSAAARVDDSQLSDDQLADLVDAIPPADPSEGPNSGQRVRNTIQLWVLVEVAGEQFDTEGIPLTDDDLAAATGQLETQLADFASRPDNVRNTLVRAQATLNRINTLPDAATFIEDATAAADIFVDPRFGTFDPVEGVIALGGSPTPPASG